MTNTKNILANIVEKRKVSLAQTLSDTDVPDNLAKSTRSLFDALNQPEFGFILECKKASPSKGLIREGFDIDTIIDTYTPYADAISVLTEPEFFQGDFDYVKRASARCSQPILCKDFVLSPEHIRLARFHGADAVLLMLSVLSDTQYLDCARAAAALDMDVLTEVHNHAELERAIAMDAKIIGINNRDLKTLKTTFAPTETLADYAPKDRIIITESGISSHADVMHLAHYANACLVGSSLMAHADLRTAVEQLIYGDVKICATTNQADVDLLNTLPCSQIGQVFVPQSKRAVALDAVSLKSKKPKIGIFDRAYHSLEDIAAAVTHHGLAGVQLHGDETASDIEVLREKLPHVVISKAIHVTADTQAEEVVARIADTTADECLLDAAVKGSNAGGTGKAFDWSLLDALDLTSTRIAGGINPDNVRELKSHGAIKIDLATGSEASVGVKSPEKLQRLFANAKILSKRGKYDNNI